MSAVCCSRSGRVRVRCTLLAGTVALLVLAVCVFTHREVALEYWLVWKLESNTAAERQRAAFKLGAIGTHRALPSLMRTVQRDDDRTVREIAIVAMFEVTLRDR